MNESIIRSIVRKIISENYQGLEEAKKGNQFDLYLEFALSQVTPEVSAERIGNVNVMEEVKKALSTKLDKVFYKDFEYPNFYIVKLGRFVVKTNDGIEPLAFNKKGEENKKFSYTYLYIYRNTTELIRFGSSFFEPDEILIKDAKDYIANKKINLVTRTESGKIIVDDNFSKDNVIDLTDYSQIQRPETPSLKRAGSAYVPKSVYRIGDKIMHRDFGKGEIVSAKKIKSEVPTYDVTVRFKQGERTVDKTIRMPQKKKDQVQ